jgi:hypothetical protein
VASKVAAKEGVRHTQDQAPIGPGRKRNDRFSPQSRRGQDGRSLGIQPRIRPGKSPVHGRGIAGAVQGRPVLAGGLNSRVGPDRFPAGNAGKRDRRVRMLRCNIGRTWRPGRFKCEVWRSAGPTEAQCRVE